MAKSKATEAIQAIVPKGSSKDWDAKDVDLLEEHLAYSPDDEVIDAERRTDEGRGDGNRAAAHRKRQTRGAVLSRRCRGCK